MMAGSRTRGVSWFPTIMQDRHGDVKLNHRVSRHVSVGAVCVYALRKACHHTLSIPSAPARACGVVGKGEKGPESRPVAPHGQPLTGPVRGYDLELWGASHHL
jgi:hypothetical protein